MTEKQSFKRKTEYQNGNVIFTESYDAQTGILKVSKKYGDRKRETICFDTCHNVDYARIRADEMLDFLGEGAFNYEKAMDFLDRAIRLTQSKEGGIVNLTA